MKNALLFISLLIFSTCSTDSSACSIFTNRPAKFHWFDGHRKLPAEPIVEIEEIMRAGDMGEICTGVAILTITIPIDRSNPAFAYKFELLSGTPEPIFLDEPVVGVNRVKGKKTFIFRWIEQDVVPMNAIVRVTAYSRSGRKGGSSEIRISDPGR